MARARQGPPSTIVIKLGEIYLRTVQVYSTDPGQEHHLSFMKKHISHYCQSYPLS